MKRNIRIKDQWILQSGCETTEYGSSRERVDASLNSQISEETYCGFYLGNKPIFGVNLYGAPRFCIWITREEAAQFNHQCEFEAYYPRATYAIYPISATLDTLFPILEFAYRKQRGY